MTDHYSGNDPGTGFGYLIIAAICGIIILVIATYLILR